MCCGLSSIKGVNTFIKDSDREVLLVFPGRFKAPNPQLPLSMLHLSSFLLHEGYNVRILDMRIENYDKFNIGNPVFVGISSMSGLQIHHGLDFAKRVRASHPSCPIVWGGVHPTLLPEQTMASEYVDIVVRGEGESTIIELANALAANETLDKIKSINYKSGGKMKSNPDAQLIDLDLIPLDLPYELLQLDKYPSFRIGRFHLQTSRGCPHRCGFCYNSVFNKRRWRGKTVERVLEEIEFVTKKFPNVRCIDFIDDNFFVDEERVKGICRGILKRGINVTWRANCRFDYMSRYSRDFIDLLDRSGCVELDFGAETGSKRLLSLINKDVTRDQMIQSVENLNNWGSSIEPYAFWMSGLPTETEADLKETFDIMDRLSEKNKRMQHIEICIYTPFPSPILERFGSEFALPNSLEEWGNVDIFHRRPPWHSKEYVDKLESISAVTRYAFYPETRIRELGFWYRAGYRIINKIAKFRWKHKYFGASLGLKVITAAVRKLRGY